MVFAKNGYTGRPDKALKQVLSKANNYCHATKRGHSHFSILCTKPDLSNTVLKCMCHCNRKCYKKSHRIHHAIQCVLCSWYNEIENEHAHQCLFTMTYTVGGPSLNINMVWISFPTTAWQVCLKGWIVNTKARQWDVEWKQGYSHCIEMTLHLQDVSLCTLETLKP